MRRISVRNGLEKTVIRREINKFFLFPPQADVAKLNHLVPSYQFLLADTWKLNLLQHLPFRDEDLMDKVCFTLE